MCDIADLNWLGESILHQEYNRLYAFFQRAWDNSHAYIVMMARRCFNLNHIFMQVHKASGGIIADENRIISDSALLLYAGNIARYYAEHYRFPYILIADDLAYHGRAIIKLLGDLECLVVSTLEEMYGPLSGDARHYLHKDMVAAIDISVFAVGSQPLLIEADYLYKLDWDRMLHLNDLKNLSQQISSFLQKADIPNTSYALSFSVPGDFDDEGALGWSKQTWQYRGTQEEFFFCYHLFNGRKPASQNNFLPTVRFRRMLLPQKHPKIWLTGTVLFGKTKAAVFDWISERILGELAAENIQVPHISFILAQKHPLLQKPRTQFISFLLSIICVRDFSLNNFSGKVSFDFARSDIDKISRNFARKSDIEWEITAIDNPVIWNRLRSIMYLGFCENAQPFLKQPESFLEIQVLPQKMHYQSLNNAVESVMEQIGMDSEKQAYDTICGRRRFRPYGQSSGTIHLENYWNSIEAPDPDKVACTLMLMDSGLMSMNTSESDNNDLQIQLKAGELATFSTPRYFHIFIPALAIVEREHWRLDLDGQTAVEEFVKSLPDTVEVQGELTGALMREQHSLQKLKKDGRTFIERLYSCGHSLNSWDFELVTADDWRDEDSGSYLSFVRYQTARQDVYIEKARRFLGYF